MRVCVVGLHCCGDLTPDLLRMVSGQVNPDLCALVVVGCCYHKMSLRGNVSHTWKLLLNKLFNFCRKNCALFQKIPHIMVRILRNSF